MKQYILILLLFFSVSCRQLLTQHFGMNSNTSFISREAYIRHLEKNNIPASKVLLPDSTSRLHFFMHIASQNRTVFYGSFLNDSTALIASPSLQENMGCLGRVLSQIRNDVLHKNDSLLVKSELHRFRFNYLHNSAPFYMDMPGKITVLLLYGHNMGRYFNEVFRETLEFEKEHDHLVDVRIIALDLLPPR